MLETLENFICENNQALYVFLLLLRQHVLFGAKNHDYIKTFYRPFDIVHLPNDQKPF